MVAKLEARRPRGRPKQFDPEVGLDHAVKVFWRVGYDGADMQMLADAMGVSKPSVYDAFGSKEQLLLRSLERYGQSVGAEPLHAFRSAATLREGIAAFFFTVAINVSGEKGPTGCLHACVGSQCAETMPPVREFLAAVMAAAERVIADRFNEAVRNCELPATIDAQDRARLMVDLMQALAVRARSGVPLERLKAIAASNVETVLIAIP